ncbi:MULTISPECIES: ABC-F family ATP-binding cassette domain-containing protein [unclassified Variovorax]|uniref:ABC-F family ATP-binding cassette domain-containing protein n=1 Tax=unclassified Variovorax TaxID=663243 RepID=UPI0008CB244C|nr:MULTISPECIES: ABC-F family ATP-binding cassette domain-containing protein [unclassified Variovorax]SEK01002.1 ATPase components of ABC transporters with duplicated ATPase domains [Variovorax sp. OK202]SFD30471.1 ATPase components of ABC transporters with duplicated ATPase domains [Variovorax sp. OK212]
MAHRKRIARPAAGPDASFSSSAQGFALRHVGLVLPDGRVLFDDIDQTFPPGRIGLVGNNGAGKSRLMALLAGHAWPSAGVVLRPARLAHVPQHIATAPGASVADLAGLAQPLAALARIEAGSTAPSDFDAAEGHWDLPARLAAALEAAGLALAPHRPADGLSGGERTRVALLGAFLSGADALLLDEPTNHLDAGARRWLREQLAAWRGTAVVASHDRELLEGMDRIAEITPDGRLRTCTGGWTVYSAWREREAAAAQARLDHARTERAAALRELRKQHDAQQRRAARGASWAREANLAAIHVGRLKDNAQAHAGRESERQRDQRESLDSAVREAAAQVRAAPAVALALPASGVPAGRRVLRLEEAVPALPPDARPLTLCLHGPVRVGITGPNGCGKTSLLRMLAGRLAPASGLCDAPLRSAWLDQGHGAGAGDALPSALCVLQQLHALRSPLPDGDLRTRLALLGLGAHTVCRPASGLSGGERLKAALACALWGGQPAEMLLLDEPTNHLDVASVLALEQALRGFPGVIVVVSHDPRFLSALALTHRLEAQGKGWVLRDVRR